MPRLFPETQLSSQQGCLASEEHLCGKLTVALAPGELTGSTGHRSRVRDDAPIPWLSQHFEALNRNGIGALNDLFQVGSTDR
jgi:hypothetical protein